MDRAIKHITLITVLCLLAGLSFAAPDFSELKALAKQGDSESQYKLGLMYQDGDEIPEDTAEAAKWFQLAAEQSFALAQFKMGIMHFTGSGVPQDDAEAVRWLRLAAEQDLGPAQISLSSMYRKGRGVPQDDDEAAKWLQSGFKLIHAKYQELVAAGKLNEALPYAKASYDIGLRIYGEESKSTASLNYNYGLMLLDNGQPKNSWPVLLETLDRYERVYGKNAMELIDPLMSLGHSGSMHRSSYKEFYDRAFAIAASAEGDDSVLYAELLMEAGRNLLYRTPVLTRQSSGKLATQYLQTARELFRTKLGSDHPKAGRAAYHLGLYEFYKKHYQPAELYFSEALNSFEKPDRPSSSTEIKTHAYLVEVYENLGERDKSTAHCLAIGRMTPYDPNQEYKALYTVNPDIKHRAGARPNWGYAIVEFTVSPAGIVQVPKVVETTGSTRIGEAGIEAVERFRFAPRFVDNEPVATEGVKYKFTWENNRTRYFPYPQKNNDRVAPLR